MAVLESEPGPHAASPAPVVVIKAESVTDLVGRNKAGGHDSVAQRGGVPQHMLEVPEDVVDEYSVTSRDQQFIAAAVELIYSGSQPKDARIETLGGKADLDSVRGVSPGENPNIQIAEYTAGLRRDGDGEDVEQPLVLGFISAEEFRNLGAHLHAPDFPVLAHRRFGDTYRVTIR